MRIPHLRDDGDDARGHGIRSYSVHRDGDDGVRARDDARGRGIRIRSVHRDGDDDVHARDDARGRDDGDDALP